MLRIRSLPRFTFALSLVVAFLLAALRQRTHAVTIGDGIQLSRMGFGTMALSYQYAYHEAEGIEMEAAEAFALLRSAMSVGPPRSPRASRPPKWPS